MKISLEVLASAGIKRKKPWPKITWLGTERESLFLLDDKRVSVLYVPSGKTKRSIPKVSNLLSETISLTSSPGGFYLVGILASGDLFVWHKDKDELKTICGLAHFLLDADISLADGCQVFPSRDCSKVLLVISKHYVYLWEKDVQDDGGTKNNILLGKWSRVSVPAKILLPSPDSKAVALHALFTSTEVYGDCCQLSIVWNQRISVNITSLFIQFAAGRESGQILNNEEELRVQWMNLQNPLSNIQAGCEPIHMDGAYTCRYTNDGQILAVGVNQKCPAQTSLLFVSPSTDTVLVSSMNGCGIKEPSKKRGKQYWITDMAWTYDNLFLGLMLRNGSLGVVTRLGEPLVLVSKGCSVELGPAYFLPFTPAISVQSDMRNRRGQASGFDQTPSFNSEADPLRQRFSVTSHPSLPILLVSDGYLVVIAQLPSELSQMIFMRDLVLESSSHLKQIAETNRLDLTLANAYNLPAAELEGVKISPRGPKHARRGESRHMSSAQYRFEEPSISLNETLDSEVSLVLGADESISAAGGQRGGGLHDMSSGKIVFGEQDILLVTEGSFLKEPNSTMRALQLAKANLFTVWKLAASTTELWSANLDKIVTHAVHNVVKLFSLLLDCPQIRDLLDDPAQMANMPQAVHTASLFKVISMYKQLLDLLQLDCHQRHLLAAVLQLSHKAMSAILASLGLRQSDPRLKTLTGCFTLLKFTEKSLMQAYVSMPTKLQGKGLVPRATVGEGEVYYGGGESTLSGPQLAKRLTATWKLLYKSVTQFACSSEVSAADSRQAQALQTAIQQVLLELDTDIPEAQAPPAVSNGEVLSMDGRHTMAMNAWKQQLSRYKELGNVKNASRLLHSLLYTYILRNDLTAAVAFVDSLIVKANPSLEDEIDLEQTSATHDIQPSLMTFVTKTLRSQAFHEPDMVPCIRDRAIRQMVQSMARFMVAYFSNQTVFIFPPHNPVPLPAVHFETSIANSRIIPKYHEDLAASIRHQQLGQVWTVERALEYLLLSGLLCEAVWFADRVGDWKAAYQLSVAHTLHRRLAPPVYVGSKKPVSLPEWLCPDAIMKGRLEKLVHRDLLLNSTSSDLTMLTKVLEDIALAGVMGYVEVGSWLLAELVAKLKALLGQMTPLVTKDFYLPAPPLFCPQPTASDKLRMSLEVEDEVKLRHRASSVIQLALCVMNAAHLSIPAGAWYVKTLEAIQQKASQFKITTEGPCLDLPDTLYSFLEMQEGEGSFDVDSEDPSVRSVQSSFRDLCSLMWLLHARDKLSLCLRSREKFLSLGLDVENNEQWLRECFLTLQWAVHMVAFSRYLSDEASIYKVILSVLLELPATEDTANILAEHMYSQDNLHPEVQDRLERMLNSWQSIIIVPEADGKSVGDSLDMDEEGRKSVTFLGASPRGKSLSVYFHKQCMAADKTLKKKKQCYGSYDEYVFAESSSGQTSTLKAKHVRLNIGSRPFETKRSYLEFLDTFYSVSFSKVLEVMAGKDKMCAQPFLRCFARDIVDREMMFFVQRVAGSAHKKTQGLSVLAGGDGAHHGAPGSPSYGQHKKTRGRSVPGRTSGRAEASKDESSAAKNRPVGLFRGKSMVETPLERSHACVKRYESEPDRLDDLDLSQFSAGPSHQRQPSLASRFSQSEETLYGAKGTGQRHELGWSLTVNFGKKYTALQQLLEWLEVWGNKTHTLGLGPGEEELLHTGSQLKLQIPAQLIVLALWLLEHKYHQSGHSRRRSLSRSGRQANRTKKASRGRRAERLSKSPPGSQSPAGSIRSTRSGAGTPPIYPENSILTRQSAPKRAASPNLSSHQVGLTGSRHSSPATPPPGPAQASTLEEDQIIDAYTQVLDGPEDSSSIAVSSLASDELDEDLKNTFNALKRSNSPAKDNSALNHTIFPKDESPERGAPRPQNSSTPKQADSLRGQRTPSVSPPRAFQQAVMERSVSERTSRSDRRGQQRVVSQGSLARGQHNNSNHAPVVGDGIAAQLQGIIRDELRRIMEVQHRSVLAMMGALDEVGGVPGPSPAPQALAPSPQPVKNTSSSQRGKSLRHSKSLSHNQVVDAENRENLEDESVAEMVSFKEEIVAQHSVQTHTRPRDGQRGGHIRGALSELHNLQAQTAQPYHQPSYVEDISSRANRIFSQNNGNSSRDGSIRLPLLAWENNQDLPAGPFPLLHIGSAQETDPDPFRNLRRFWPQVPPPQPFRTPPSFSQPSQPPSYSPFNQFPIPPAPQPQQGPPQYPNYDPASFPLLSVPGPSQLSHPAPPAGSTPAPGFFPLLRILPPGASEQELQRSKIEETRQRLLQKFQQQVYQDKENMDQGQLAQRLLHLEPQPGGQPLDSARSEKSQPSEKLPSEKLVSREEVPATEEQERAASAQSGATGTGGLDGTMSDAGRTGSMAADASINDGYALPRGIFESYLQLGEHLIGPEAGQTSAAFQLKMAQAMQRQVEKRIRPKVDFSTMTQEQVDMAMATDPAMEVVRTAEAATSITRDTGVDPIEEAVRDYNLKRHNNVVPPDIFMGLRFADQDGQAGVAPGAPSDEPGKGRAYLNVVDIRASAVLRDIPDRTDKEQKDKEEYVGQTDLGSAMLASQRAALQMGALEDTLREKLAPQTSGSTAARGHDSLTVRMFDQLQAGREERMSVAVIPRSSMSEPKAAMLRRLQDMSDQIKAIDDMSQNIEREFKSSHLLLNTIQDVNASIQRSRSPSPDRSRVSPRRHKELRYSFEDRTQEFDEEDEVGSGGTLTPHLPTPKTSAKSPQASARSARSKGSLASRSASEVTELLTEVLAEQGVDMQSAGFSKELAQQLEMDAREQMARQDAFAKSRITPREKLESMKRADEQAGHRTREEREELKKWMASKFHERQEDYKKHRQELIEREPKPFKSGQAATKFNLHKLDEERSERRQHMVADFMNQRLTEAEHLMGSIIVDKPEMPSWGALATGEAGPTSQTYIRPTDAGRSAKRKSRSPARRMGPGSHRPQTSSKSPSDTKLPRSTMPTTVKGILKPSVTSTTLAGEPNRLSSSDLHLPNLASLSAEGLSVDSSADIINYARQILEIEGATPGDSYEILESPPLALGRRQPSRSPVREVRKTAQPKQAKVKSFADMVRLQRPAVTRKWQDVNRQRQQSAAAAARQAVPPGQKTWTLQDPNLVNGKPKEYGSKQIPGSSPRQQAGAGPASARRVKTYTERLQEMKPASNVYSPPVTRRRPASARTMSTVTTRSASQRGPAHKPQTYVEQLKSLSSRAGGSRRGHTGQQGKVPVKMRTFLRSHGPAHLPKTYTEQLKELNPHPHMDSGTTTRKLRSQATYPSGRAASIGPGSRASSRPRPYGDPYSEMDYEELASVLSDWDMDENVRNIIYGGSAAASSVVLRDDIDMSMSGGDIRRPVAPSEGQSDYFDVVMEGDGLGYRPDELDDFDLGVGDYRSSVDVHEIERIADAASVGSGSVLSVIDWDAVNDLIKDV